MQQVEVSVSELRQNLATFVNRVAFGEERIVLVSHGEPKAALIGLAELRQLQEDDLAARAAAFQRSLTKATQLRTTLTHWQEGSESSAEDIVETLHRIRGEQLGGYDDLH